MSEQGLKSISYRPTPGGKISPEELYQHIKNLQADIRTLSSRLDALTDRVAALEATP